MKGCYTYEGVCAHVHLFQNGESQQIQDRMNLWLHATYTSKEERPLPEFLTAMPGDDVIIIQDWVEMLGDDVADNEKEHAFVCEVWVRERDLHTVRCYIEGQGFRLI